MSDQSQTTSEPIVTPTPGPLGNDQMRSPTGELKDQSTTPLTTEPKDDKSGQTPAKDATAGPPDKYDLKTTEGSPELDARTIAEFTPIARELGLDNAQAQRLVDFYNKEMKSVTDAVAARDKQVIEARNEKYMTALKADPEIGSKLDQVKADIGRAYAALDKPELVAAFQKEMDQSPEGNNPAFVKMIHAMAQALIEGKPVPGNGPSKHGQTPSGNQPKPSIAEAMYPNLVRH